jgi:hypothetical protein
VNIFEKIRELSLPKNTYVVVGGGVLVALGLIKWDEDIDITVTPEIFNNLKAHNWQQDQWQDKIVLKHDVYDIGVGFGHWNLEQLLEDALWIENIPFISLEKLTTWKLDMGRPKDLAHIKIIMQHLLKATE